MAAISPPFENRSVIDVLSRATHPPEIRSEIASLGLASVDPPRVEILEWDAARRFVDDWRDLLGRSLEPNPFLEPAFALSLAQQSPLAHRPLFMVARAPARDDMDSRLLGVCPLNRVNGRFGKVARVWMPKLMALGTPLLDAQSAPATLDLMLSWFARRSPQTAGLLIPSLPSEGPTAALLRERARRLGLAVREFDAHRRAMLASEAIGGTPLEDEISAKKKKEMRRQRRRIEELGEVAWTSARDRRAVRAALERFYVLEASGWKGRNGTALIDDAAVATFGRAMTRQLAADGRCQIDALEVDGHPIAMGVTIRSGRFAALWKIAYDENLAARSPGVQFILEYTRRQLADGGVDLTDSCAMPDHPMIDHIWRDRVAITDMFVPVAAASAVAFNAASGREAFRRVARAFAKRVYHEARARKRGPPPGRAA